MARRPRRKRVESPFSLNVMTGRDAVIASMCATGWRPTDLIQTTADIAEVWKQNRDTFMTLRTAENNYAPYGYTEGTRPLLWWLFEAEEPPRPGESQEQCLHRLRILTDREREILDRQRQHEKTYEREHREQAAAEAAIKAFNKRYTGEQEHE